MFLKMLSGSGRSVCDNNNGTRVAIIGVRVTELEAAALSKNLSTDEQITHLELSRNGISDAAPIFAALRTNTTLQTLRLCG